MGEEEREGAGRRSHMTCKGGCGCAARVREQAGAVGERVRERERAWGRLWPRAAGGYAAPGRQRG